MNNGTEHVPKKFPQRYVQVSYSVFEPPLRNPEQCEPKVQIQPLTNFAQVPITTPTIPFRELQADDTLTMLMPQQPLYPTSKFHVPVYITQSMENRPILSFTMKVRVKSGIKILSATPFNDMWNISFEKENQKHTTVRVTALRKDSKISSSQEENAGNSDAEMMLKNNYTTATIASVEKYILQLESISIFKYYFFITSLLFSVLHGIGCGFCKTSFYLIFSLVLV